MRDPDPNTVTHIRGSFKDCSGLIAVEIPDSVQEIGEYAFSGCTNLTSVSITNSIQEIRYNTFSGCTSLTSIIIPNSVKEIGYWAFSGCTTLKSVTIPDSVCKLDTNAFENYPNLFSVQFSRINEYKDSFPAYFTLRENRISRGKCTYCGGNFKLISLLHVTCKNCGRRKDY